MEGQRSPNSTIVRPGPVLPRPSQAEQAHREEMLALLGRFTSAVAHDVRNPLTAIGAGVQYLARTRPGTAEERETFEMLLAEVRRLDRLLEDFCDAGRPPRLNLGPHDPCQIAARAIESASGIAAERGVRVEVEADPAVGRVVVDPERLERLLTHLLWNAAEASPRGARVVLRIRDASRVLSSDLLSESESFAVVFEVADDGEGIAPENEPRIFEPFFTTKKGHRGLGLPACQMIAEAHHGALRVESEPGAGSTFTLMLPRLGAEAESA
jgi:signal transduction histidine kinase